MNYLFSIFLLKNENNKEWNFTTEFNLRAFYSVPGQQVIWNDLYLLGEKWICSGQDKSINSQISKYI